ncbi:hypothetical protein O1D97_01825 [Marinomonas sp. 15G1-11]|uniref:Immunity MXAN-0049 protein domain-containing protein n=1 Tax=Marinomonas phaeophyticola TaxID=3004091 RepID=A0ABT4JPW9_9GAMM|nr:DUF1629 domain-containing protein [Marinomonas sp. 15G1-11]MCZ2720414.1 hypothetical protein [Marinomonas sp. 15G1-11]
MAALIRLNTKHLKYFNDYRREKYMSATITPDHSEEYPNFRVSFVSEQDQENYIKLQEEIKKYITDGSNENISRIQRDEPLLDFVDFRTYKLLHPVNDALLPEKVCLLDPNSLRDFSHYTDQIYVVSERFKAVIESVEPSIHYFKPFELVDQTGLHVARYYFFRCMNIVDALIEDSEGFIKVNKNFTRHQKKNLTIFGMTISHLIIKKKIEKEKISGKACFHEVHINTKKIMIPDKVRALLEEQNIGPIIYNDVFTEV